MPDNNIKIGVQVSDNGSTGQTSKNVKNVKDVLDQTTASANKATKAITAMNAAQAGGGRATTTKLKQATGGDSGDERGMYAAQRGAVGTGAAGRDFSKESQGLGGLVRLYATFAANIFAVGAAFNALSQAMDTTNMVKGLDQLGAATGQNLGGLSKRFVELTDGALSFKDAMAATVKVTSAGLGTDTVTRLAVVAKKASQSLGVDMADAVSRLSRGITKIEPELLDELGIFTKIDKAQEDYARSLGRTVTSLSDFEKRQAFANAVLTEGEKKFNAIQIDVNPYSQLLATLKNVAQSGLEFVNKFLGPVVKLLAESPTGVALALAGIAAVLTKQAIPAVASFREGLVKANEQALAKIKELQENIEARKGIAMQQAANIDVQKQVDKLDASAKGLRTKAANQIKEAEDAAFAGDEARANKLYAQAQKKLKSADEYKDKIIETRKQAELLDTQQTAAASKNIFAQENIIQRQKTSMEQSARLSKTLLNIADDTATFGAAAGFKRLSVELKNAGKESEFTGAALSKLQIAGLAVRGTFGVLTTAVSSILGAFGPWIAALGLVLPLLSMFYDWLRKDATQAEETAKSFETLGSSIDNTARTIERINKLDFGEQLTADTIIARSNALNDLSGSFTKVLESITKQKAAQSPFAKWIDNITGGIQKEGAEKLSKSIVLALQSAQEGTAKDEAKKTLKTLLGVDVLTEADIKAAIVRTKDFDTVTTKAGEAISSLAKEDDKRSKGLQGAKEAQDKVTKSYDEFIQSVLKTDPVTTLAKNMISFGLELDKTFQDPISSIAELNRIAGDSKTLAMFTPAAQNNILEYNTKLQGIQKEIDIATAAERNFTEELEKQKKQRDEGFAGRNEMFRRQEEYRLASPERKAILDKQEKEGKGFTDEMKGLLDSSNKQAEIIKNLRSDLTKTATKASEIIKAPESVFSRGMDLFIKELDKSYGKAGLLLAEAVASAYGDLPGAATLTAELKNKELANQINLIDATITLTKATQEAALRTQEANVLEKIKMYGADPAAGAMLKVALEERDAIEKLKVEFSNGTKGTTKELKELKERAEKATPGERAALKPIIDASLVTAGAKGQKAVLGAQQKVNVFQAGLAERTAEARAQEKFNNLIKQENTLAVEKLSLQRDGLGLLQEETVITIGEINKRNIDLTLASKSANLTAEEKNLRQLLGESEAKLSELKKQGLTADKQAIANQQTVITNANTKLIALSKERDLAKETADIEKNKQDIKTRLELLQNTIVRRTEELFLLDSIRERQNLLNQSEQEVSDIKLQSLKDTNSLYDEQYNKLKLMSDLKKIELSDSKQLEDAEKQRRDAVNTITDAMAKARASNPQADLTAQVAKLDEINAKYLTQVDIIKAKTGAEQDSVLALAASTELLRVQEERMAKIVSLTQSLTSAFGEVGTAIGGVITTLQKQADAEVEINKKKEASLATISDVGVDLEQAEINARKRAKIETKAENEIQQSRVASAATAAGETKKMFKEKTFAYKAFAGIEKALHVASMVMKVQAMVADGTFTATSIANGMERLFVSGKEAIMNAYAKIPPPFNIAAAAVMTGIVASLIGKAIGGGGGGGVPAGSTAEERQKVQGTGQKYVDGKLVDTGLGVLGDPTKQLETISNGISYLEKYAVGNLEYSNDMLDALKGIRENTGSFVTTLIKTNIAKKELSTSGGNWLTGKSSAENIDKLLSVAGTIQQVIDKTAEVTQIIVNKVTEDGGLLGSLFGQGSDVSVVRLPEKFTASQEKEINNTLSLLFKNMAQGVETGAAALNLKLDPAWKTLFKLPDNFETSLMGLSFEDMGKAIEANVGLTLSAFVDKTYPQLQKFQKAGEDLGTMFFRLASDSRTVREAFNMVGISLTTLVEGVESVATTAQRTAVSTTAEAMMAAYAEVDRVKALVGTTITSGQDEGYSETYIGPEKLTEAQDKLTAATAKYTDAVTTLRIAETASTTNNIEAEQRIISLNGGMDSFLSKLKEYNSSILTAGDRTQIARTSYDRLITTLDAKTDVDLRSVMSTIKTKDQFQALYASIDQTTPAGAAFGAVLNSLVPSFAAVTDAAKKYDTALEDQKVKMGALGIAGGLTPDQAKTLQRERERVKIAEEYTAAEATVLIANQNAIWQAEDTLDLRKRENSILAAQGYTYEALLENRRLELSLLTDEQKIRQLQLYAAEDENKTRALNIELLEAQGDSTGALYAKRVQELKGMSLTDQELKRRIWLLQDEKKVLAAKNAQEIKIYELLGNSTEALRLQREAELEAMDAALRPGQRYIYALQDQKTIYDKLKTTISNTTNTLKASIQTLKDYQTGLKTGEKTILKPDEVYALRKQEFFDLKSIAESVATTPAEEALQAAAISKLPTAADAFLESSRTLFASGQAYTDDFNLVDSILTSLTTTLTGQLSDAEKSLAELKTSNGFLESIDANSEDTADLMARLLVATANVTTARAAASAAGYVSAGGRAGNFNTGAGAGIPDVQQSSTATQQSGRTFTPIEQMVLGWYARHPDQLDRNPLDDGGLEFWSQAISSRPNNSDTIAWAKLEFANAVARNYNKPLYTAFADGGLASGLAMVGEEGPELVDFKTPGRVYPADQTSAMLANNTALVEEIKALRQEVEKLRSEQKEQTGHLITTNYDANRIAAEMLAKATEESSKEMAWAGRSAARVV